MVEAELAEGRHSCPGEWRIRLVPAARLEEVAPVWRRLERQLDNTALACSWTWTSTWVRHFGDLVRCWFALGEWAGEVRGAALVTLERSGGPASLRPRVLHLGTAGEPADDTVYVEYNRLLVDRRERAAFGAALLERLERATFWDALALDGFALDDAEELVRLKPGMDLRRVPSPVVGLAGAPGGDVIQAMRPHTRQKIRRTQRALADLQLEWAETAGQALDIFEELAALSRRRWERAGRRSVFASARFTSFHRDLIPKLLREGAVALIRVRSGAATVGCLYCFIEDRRALFYQSGLRDLGDNRLKPGLLVHALCAQACRDRGLVEYDLLAGDERYKRELATGERHLVWAVARRHRARWTALAALRAGRRAARRLVSLLGGPWPHPAQPVPDRPGARPRKRTQVMAALGHPLVAPWVRRLSGWSGLLVLNYHRLGNPHDAPFDRGIFSATPDALEQHLRVLKECCEVVAAGDLPLVVGRRGRYALLTFDDGYREHFETALPLLRGHGLSAVFFLATAFQDRPRLAWWDEIAWMVRHSRRPGLAPSPWIPAPLSFDETAREVAIRRLIARYKRLPGPRANEFLDYLAEATGSGRADAELGCGVWLSWDMARSLRCAGMAIGAHSVTHPILARLDPSAQAQEIQGSIQRIEAELRERVDLFAYPVGSRDSFDAHTRAALQRAGVRYAFSFYGGIAPLRQLDPMDIRRVSIGPDVDGRALRALLALPQAFSRR